MTKAAGRLKPGTFRVLPDRAFEDKRLSATDYRVLAAIAFHDRGGANGRGCYATQSTIAARAGCHRAEVSRSIARLIGYGHLVAEKGAGRDGRRNMLSILYEKAETGSGSRTQSEEDCVGEPHDSPGMCGSADEYLVQDQSVADDKEILLSAGRISGETMPAATRCSETHGQRRCSETATLPTRVSPSGTAREPEARPRPMQDGEKLARAQRELKSGRVIAADELLAMYRTFDAICEAQDGRSGDRIGGWALRLGEEVADRMDEETFQKLLGYLDRHDPGAGLDAAEVPAPKGRKPSRGLSLSATFPCDTMLPQAPRGGVGNRPGAAPEGPPEGPHKEPWHR